MPLLDLSRGDGLSFFLDSIRFPAPAGDSFRQTGSFDGTILVRDQIGRCSKSELQMAQFRLCWYEWHTDSLHSMWQTGEIDV